MAPFTEEWVQNGDTKFYTRIYEPVGDVKGEVLMVHGFIEHCGRHEWMAKQLQNAGYGVVGFDQRGFGRTALDDKNKSPGSAYGRTHRALQLSDLEFFLKFTYDRFKHDSLFIYGHSMGGALALSYPCLGEANGMKKHLKGIVATSPLIETTHPPSSWIRAIGGGVSRLMPYMMTAAPVNKDALADDPSVAAAYLSDPLVIQKGSLLHISSMLNGGEDLNTNHGKLYPKTLPLLMFHGDKDQVCSYPVSNAWFKGLKADNKTYHTFENGLHELHNEPKLKDRLATTVIEWLGKHPSSNAEPITEPTEPISEVHPKL